MNLRFKYSSTLSCILFATTLSTNNAYADEGLPNITILATGGTIAGTAASNTSTTKYDAAKLGIDQLLEAVPEIKKLANIKGEQVMQVPSTNMNNELWLKLAKRVNELLAQKDVDGILITHGTDTLEETAYFLDLVVKSKKPVVLVGSMRPATAMSADGPMNLYNGVVLAASKDAYGKGVLTMMNDQIGNAREITKTNTSTTNTFRTWDMGFLGYVQGDKAYFYQAPNRKHTADTEFDVSKLDKLPTVEIVYAYANSNSIVLKAFIDSGAQGIVYAGLGNGAIPEPVKQPLADTVKKGIAVVRASRVGSGVVTRNGYYNDDELGYVAADSLTPQKARILLTLALTKTKDPKEIQRMFYAY